MSKDSLPFLGTMCEGSDDSTPRGFEGPIRREKSHVDVSKNSGTRKSSTLIGFSILNHPFWGTLIFGNTHVAFNFPPLIFGKSRPSKDRII